ncbi:MAG: hypothetical protein QM699_16425 [Amaricoccus sp.]|uniref:phosphorylase family protein n=1 Tax=Amaricoccus sp. TaxID=1872485 RepID=UPI0039E48007
MTRLPEDFPVLWDTTDAPSAFEPADWFAYCSRLNGRPIPVLPPLAIQTVTRPIFDLAVSRHGARVDDFTLADHPFARFEVDGVPMVIGYSGKGSYAAGGLDELIALGARKVIFLGGSGSISPRVAVNDLVVATKALRDECVSCHYIPPSRYAFAAAALSDALAVEAQSRDRTVHIGPVWTTMAHFRQTLPRVEAFRAEGCLVVNNEASSAFAVGQARGVEVAALLNTGDLLYNGHFEVPPERTETYQGGNIAAQLDIAIAALLRVTNGDGTGDDHAA